MHQCRRAFPEAHPVVEAVRVRGIEACDLRSGARLVLPESEVLAAAEGQYRERIDRTPHESVALELEVVDDALLEVPAHVRAGRHAVAREELFGVGGAADPLSALEHGDVETGAGQVEGGDEAVVASADDHYVKAGS